MGIGILTEKAAMAACLAHESIGQTRKYGGRRYYTHPLAVAALCHTVPGCDEGVFTAACLHDVLEDVAPKNPTYDARWIANEFGADVLNLVSELTNEFTKERYPDLNRNQRKAKECNRIATISDRAKIVKRADLYHNSTEISPDARFWEQWMREKTILDDMIGRWEDTAPGILINGDVYIKVGADDQFVMLVMTHSEADRFHETLKLVNA